MKNTLRFLIIAALVATAVNPVFAQDGSKTEAYFKILSSGNFHMKAKMMEGNTETTIETFVKSEQMATTISAQGETTRVIYKDKKTYMIMDSLKMVMVTAMNSLPEAGNIKTDGMKFTGSGTAKFNGKNLSYDEYSGPNGEKIQFFIDGNNLAGIRNIIPRQNPIDIIILALDQNIPNNVFDIPAGYQVQDMSSFGM
jgi:outer membrane lipoprotein-sorting protein